MTWLLAAVAALGVYWTLVGAALVLWAVWALVRLPYDLRHLRGD